MRRIAGRGEGARHTEQDDAPAGEQIDELADAIEAIGDRLTAVEGTAQSQAFTRPS